MSLFLIESSIGACFPSHQHRSAGTSLQKKKTQIQVPALHKISTMYDSKLAGLDETRLVQSIREKSCVTLYDSVSNLGGGVYRL